MFKMPSVDGDREVFLVAVLFWCAVVDDQMLLTIQNQLARSQVRGEVGVAVFQPTF